MIKTPDDDPTLFPGGFTVSTKTLPLGKGVGSRTDGSIAARSVDDLAKRAARYGTVENGPYVGHDMLYPDRCSVVSYIVRDEFGQTLKIDFSPKIHPAHRSRPA